MAMVSVIHSNTNHLFIANKYLEKIVLQIAFDKYSHNWDRDIVTLSGLITGESISTSDVDNLVKSTPSTDNVCFDGLLLNSFCILNE